jgi:hypothetical protein
MPCFNAVEAAKSILIPREDCFGVARVRVPDHLQKLSAFIGSIAGDSFVGVPPNDSITSAFGELGDFLLVRTFFCLGIMADTSGILSVIKSLHNHW